MPQSRHAIVLAAGLFAAAAFAQPQLEPRFNQVELQAEVTREIANDLMTATVYVEVNEASAAQVANRLNRTIAEGLKTAAEANSVKAQSGASHTFPVYDRAQKLTGWRGRAEIRLESKDIRALADLIGKLQSSMQLGQVAFVVSPELRRQTENELIVQAVAAFRGRADIATKALGGKGYKIRRLAINTGGSFPGPRPMLSQRAMAQSADVAPPVFEGGTSTVQVGASGTIELE